MNKEFKLDINGQTQLKYAMDITFDRMRDELEDIEKDVLNVGAFNLKQAVKDSFSSKMPAATRPVRNQIFKGKSSRSGYAITTNEPLIEAVRQTKVNSATKSTKVHILGGKQSGSPLFMARFFENGTQERYAVYHNGKKLKNKRSTGKLRGYHFFEPVISDLSNILNIMGEVYEHKINDIITNG